MLDILIKKFNIDIIYNLKEIKLIELLDDSNKQDSKKLNICLKILNNSYKSSLKY